MNSGNTRAAAGPGGLAVLALVLLAALFQGCVPGTEADNPFFAADLVPPMLESAEVQDEFHAVFRFDEDVFTVERPPVLTPPLGEALMHCQGRELVVEFAEAQVIGESYTLRASVQDEKGNILEFLYGFSGWNPRVPVLLINELNPRGSGNTPDCIELLALSDGNLGGVLCFVGTEAHPGGSIRFPAVEILEGDYILVHAKSQGLPEELNETGSISESGGLLASDTARDFWMPGSPGLPGNNGAVTLRGRAGGSVVDAVLWSDRQYDPQDDKLGWTSAGYKLAADLALSGGWPAGSTTVPTPSDAVDVSFSSATRSLCRASVPQDTDSRADWHTVPVRGASFGAVNTDEVYQP